MEILLLHKGEKQKLLHFQKKVSKDRDHKLRVQDRKYKHMTHKWHRRQRQLLPMGKYYSSIKARSRNSFTVSKELKTTGTKSTRLTSKLQRCDPKKKQMIQRLMLPLGKYYCSIKARSRNSFTVTMVLDTIETKTTSLTSRLQRCDPQTAQDTIFPASFVEILLLHKGEKQKLLHFQ